MTGGVKDSPLPLDLKAFCSASFLSFTSFISTCNSPFASSSWEIFSWACASFCSVVSGTLSLFRISGLGARVSCVKVAARAHEQRGDVEIAASGEHSFVLDVQVNNGRDETVVIKRVRWTARNNPAYDPAGPGEGAVSQARFVQA